MFLVVHARNTQNANGTHYVIYPQYVCANTLNENKMQHSKGEKKKKIVPFSSRNNDNNDFFFILSFFLFSSCSRCTIANLPEQYTAGFSFFVSFNKIEQIYGQMLSIRINLALWIDPDSNVKQNSGGQYEVIDWCWCYCYSNSLGQFERDMVFVAWD